MEGLRYTNESSPLEKAVYLAINKFHNKESRPPTGVYFNKVMSILHHRSKSKYDLRLPHCWYRWGDEVVRRCLPNEVT
ncbi:MAG: hypothetical protein R6V01_07215 [Thermoplasmatota archaeon]